MPESLLELESRRAAVQSQIAQLGDMRSGSITETGGHCGNPNCHCHQANDPGHGPYYRLTRKVNGKTLTETFASPASLSKAQREVAERQRFRDLSDQLLEVNEQICQLRPVVETSSSAQKKNGGNDPKGSRARSRATVACHLPRSAAKGTPGSGSHRDGDAFGGAPSRSGSADPALAISGAGCRSAHSALRLRPAGRLPGVAIQANPHGGREGGSIAALLLVPTLP